MKAYKVETVEKMRALLKEKDKAERTEDATGEHQSVVIARFTPDPAPDMLGAAVVVPGEPAVQQKQNPIPARLKHLTIGEIQLMYQDDLLEAHERKWFQSRTLPNYSTPDPFYWMRL